MAWNCFHYRDRVSEGNWDFLLTLYLYHKCAYRETFSHSLYQLNGAREFVESHQNAITFRKSMFTETIVGGWQSTDQTAAEMQLGVFSRVWQMVGKIRWFAFLKMWFSDQLTIIFTVKVAKLTWKEREKKGNVRYNVLYIKSTFRRISKIDNRWRSLKSLNQHVFRNIINLRPQTVWFSAHFKADRAASSATHSSQFKIGVSSSSTTTTTTMTPTICWKKKQKKLHILRGGRLNLRGDDGRTLISDWWPTAR